jgi:hypothetical protein
MPTLNSSKAGYVIGQSSTNFTTARENGSSVVAAPTTNQSTSYNIYSNFGSWFSYPCYEKNISLF